MNPARCGGDISCYAVVIPSEIGLKQEKRRMGQAYKDLALIDPMTDRFGYLGWMPCLMCSSYFFLRMTKVMMPRIAIRAPMRIGMDENIPIDSVDSMGAD